MENSERRNLVIGMLVSVALLVSLFNPLSGLLALICGLVLIIVFFSIISYDTHQEEVKWFCLIIIGILALILLGILNFSLLYQIGQFPIKYLFTIILLLTAYFIHSKYF